MGEILVQGSLIPSVKEMISNRENFVDLWFRCRDGKELGCHRLVIGAQSDFLKELMKESEGTVIHLPEVDSRHMKIVIRFLYSGSLVVRRPDVIEVRDLIEKVLRIDDGVKIPLFDDSRESEDDEDIILLEESAIKTEASEEMIPAKELHTVIIENEGQVFINELSRKTEEKYAMAEPVSLESLNFEENVSAVSEESFQTEEITKTTGGVSPGASRILSPKNLLSNLLPLPLSTLNLHNNEDKMNQVPNIIAKNPLRKIRKARHNPYTVSGVMRESTVQIMLEASGEFDCNVCGLRYEKKSSLKVHMSRRHNQNVKAFCPECGKGLASSGAIPKHLLSHRPRSQWPFFCPICFQPFQAKTDISKHLMTSKHKDALLPPIGSREWRDLINSSHRTEPPMQLSISVDEDPNNQPPTLNSY